MEKVKLTPEQAEAIKYLKEQKGLFNHEIVQLHVKTSGAYWDGDKEKFIRALDVDALIRALYIGYEIEETYKIGDWLHVVTPNFEFVAKVIDEYDEYTEFDNGKKLSAFEFRKATPEEIAAEKERRKWAAIGREVGEYHAGDFVRHKMYGVDMVDFVDAPGVYLKALKRYCNKDEIELICPVEHRFDMKE